MPLSFIPRRRPLESRGMYHEGKQAQIGLILPGSGPENPWKAIWFWDVK